MIARSVRDLVRLVTRARLFAFALAALGIGYIGAREVRAVVAFVGESFTGPTTSTPITTGIGITASGNSNAACLTASSTAGTSSNELFACPTALNPNNGGNSGTLPDAAGSGTLRLTDNELNQSSFVIVTNPVSTAGGLMASFDLYAYGGTGSTTGADGIGFLILDGTQAVPASAGANGGSFGYAQKNGASCCNAPGIAGGYFGIGFDEYGNYSNPTEGRIGGPGFTPNAVAIRGSASDNYAYITGKSLSTLTTPGSISNLNSATRPATPINVLLSVSSTGYVEVDMDFTGTKSKFQTVIAPFQITAVANQGPLPSSLRFGFSGSTGSYTNFHEIRNFVAQSEEPQLTISKVHNGTSFNAGGTGTYTITVNNAQGAGTSTQAISVTDPLPAGETFVSATGTTWSCSAAGTPQTVTCNYTGTLPVANTTLPTITLTVQLAATTSATISNTATVNAADNAALSGTSSTDTVTVNAAPVVEVFKRILSIVTKGPTPGPTTTAHTITFTPDPGSLAGVSGTATSEPVYPGDTIAYGLYFLNAGGLVAYGTASKTLGPTFTDPLNAALSYVAGSATATCCTNPAITTTLPFTQNGQTLSWALQTPLPVASSPAAIQGSITFKATIH
jgi:uncharacterized repeat protein (TIGR01451 family)